MGRRSRISLVIRVMHPDMDLKLLGSRTDSAPWPWLRHSAFRSGNPHPKADGVRCQVPDLQAWDKSASLLREVERLRAEYRKLAAAAGGARLFDTFDTRLGTVHSFALTPGHSGIVGTSETTLFSRAFHAVKDQLICFHLSPAARCSV